MSGNATVGKHHCTSRVYGGHVEIVGWLLTRGAPVTARDEVWERTPLGWALFAWAHEADAAKRGRYHEVVDRLIAAGTRASRMAG